MTSEASLQASPVRPSVQDLLDRERVEVPTALRSTSVAAAAKDDIPISRYTSKAFAEAERDDLWPHVWQMACRQEDIPNVGDIHVYEIGTRTILIVRTEDVIKAYPNACLHRGTALRDTDGNVAELRCPFHGFCWSLDGALKDIPSAWDFPHLDREGFSLPEYRVGTWSGFVFINMDPDAPSLEEYLGGIIDHFESAARPPLEDRFTLVNVAKVLRANWKVALEAFIESYHVVATHPETMLYIGDANTQYDVYPDEPHWNRMITPLGISSPHLGPDVSEVDIIDGLRRDQILVDVLGTTELPELSELDSGGARTMLADFTRMSVTTMTGYDASNATDCEATDGIQYLVFPNFVPWIGIGAPLVYRFRPYGDDPNACIMDIRLLYPVAPGQPRPPATPVHWLAEDEDFTAAPELGGLAEGLNQDLVNLPRIQRGLHSATKPGITLAAYQESRIRHFQSTLERYVGI